MRQLKISKSITNRESQSLEKYLQEIGKVEMISAEEEVRLAKLIRNGDQHALDKLIKSNLRFVVSVAKQYQNQGLSLPDLINEGNLGLIKAAQRFDETRGFKFISYAVWWIRQSIIQSLAEQARIVRLPLNKVGLTSRVSKAVQTLEQQYEREPSVEEISEFLDIGSDEIVASLGNSFRHVSMDTPLSEGEDSTLLDVIHNPNVEGTDEQLVHNDSMKQEIERSLRLLTIRQQEVIRLFFGIDEDHPLSLEEIGSRYGITRERVRQIKDKAITKLRSTSRTIHLKSYMG
ncbi:MAG: RNA polymerase sigma factor RpoD/SigA [Bacteroidetes bacterium]|nr:RNA polymerase sigma factor RpoD/SigA [Bacteroidota bacterium]